MTKSVERESSAKAPKKQEKKSCIEVSELLARFATKIYSILKTSSSLLAIGVIFYFTSVAFSYGGVSTVVIIIALGGAFGGLAFSLEDDDSHKMRLPWAGSEIDTGVIGHIFVGICSGFVAIAACIIVVVLDIWAVIEHSNMLFNHTSNNKDIPAVLNSASSASASIPSPDQSNQYKGALNNLIYIIAVSIIGGYLGLRLISGLGSAVIAKMQKELGDQKETVEKIKRHVAINSEKGQKARKELKQLRLVKASMLMDNSEFQKAADYLESILIDSPKNALAWSWLARARRRLGDDLLAISCARKATEFDPNEWLYPYNLACYLVVLSDENTEIISLLKKSGDLASENEYDLARFSEGLQRDPDLERFRALPESRALLEQYPVDDLDLIDNTDQ